MFQSTNKVLHFPRARIRPSDGEWRGSSQG